MRSVLALLIWLCGAGAASADWSCWTPLGATSLGVPAVGRNADGRMEVFVRGRDRAVWHIWQTAPNGPFADWHSLGGGFNGDPTIGTNSDGRMELFGRGLDNALWHMWQTAPSGPFTGSWLSLGERNICERGPLFYFTSVALAKRDLKRVTNASQWQPNLFRNMTAIYPFQDNPKWNLETAMADEAIAYIKQLKEIAPGKPWFVYYVPGFMVKYATTQLC
jgi:hypothetical protein